MSQNCYLYLMVNPKIIEENIYILGKSDTDPLNRFKQLYENPESLPIFRKHIVLCVFKFNNIDALTNILVSSLQEYYQPLYEDNSKKYYHYKCDIHKIIDIIHMCPNIEILDKQYVYCYSKLVDNKPIYTLTCNLDGNTHFYNDYQLEFGVKMKQLMGSLTFHMFRRYTDYKLGQYFESYDDNLNNVKLRILTCNLDKIKECFHDIVDKEWLNMGAV